MTDFILVEGRGRANAVLALAAAEIAGHDPAIVRTVNLGYEIPADALEHYERLVQGSVDPIDVDGATGDVAVELVEPAKNASRAAWEDFAEEYHGYDKSEGLTRDQIIERYGSSE